MREDTARLGAVTSADDSGLTPLQAPDTSASDQSPLDGGRVVSLVGTRPARESETPDPSADGHAPLLILGGHRSGTSLVAGLLWHAGLFSGELLPTNPENPKGFFEPMKVVAAHEEMLNSLERDWTCPPLRLDTFAVDTEPLEDAIGELVAQSCPWGVKDPRLLFTLPVWLRLVPRVRLLGVVRHPAAVAKSLATRNGFRDDQARAIADLYVARLADLQKSLGFPVIDFDADPAAMFSSLERVAGDLGLSWADAVASDLFDPGLRHHAPKGSGGPGYKSLVAAAAADLPFEEILSTTAEIAVAELPRVEVDPVPLTVGLGFEQRRDRLWELGARRP